MARVVFLGGLGRSGTTLLERILGEVPGVCALGELVHLW
ncbi:MAG TPA: sulfotransferase, partial [Micromonosporaceae bacterium]